MHEQELVDKLISKGYLSEQQVTIWRDVAGLMAVFDAIGREGVSALVKIDGTRLDERVYTVVISGPRLGEAFFRQDGSDLSAMLRAAITFYKNAVLAGAS